MNFLIQAVVAVGLFLLGFYIYNRSGGWRKPEAGRVAGGVLIVVGALQLLGMVLGILFTVVVGFIFIVVGVLAVAAVAAYINANR
jgi:hypothetical protein